MAPALAGAGAPARQAAAPGRARIKLALALGLNRQPWLRLARQIGVNHVIAGVVPALAKVTPDRYEEALEKVKADYRAAELTIAGIEGHPVPAERIKLGVPGWEEELEKYCAAVKAMGKVGLTMLCYNFMAGLGWYRTNVKVAERAGALTSEFDNRVAQQQGLTRWGEVSEEKIWENMVRFQKAVIPVAEAAGVKMALHPDDPPISPLRGIGRILTSAKNYRRVLDIVPSPVNGITFCQANFKAMGENIEALAREWCTKKKIFFVHFRDIEGNAEHFRETFHDNGPTDMARMLQVFHKYGFDGPIRPDHAPTLEGEPSDFPGYGIQGRMFAIGYMKGILDGLRIPYA